MFSDFLTLSPIPKANRLVKIKNTLLLFAFPTMSKS